MWEAIEPAVLELVSTIIAAAIALAAIYFRRWTGVRIEEKHKRDLHDALMSGAAAAIKLGPQAGVEAMKAHAIAYARQSVPGAFRELIPGETVLDDLAEAKVREVLARFGIGKEA